MPFQGLLKQNSRGIGLPELMIVVSLVAMVSVGAMQLISGLFKSQKSVELSADFTNIYSSIQGVINNQASCKRAFETQPVVLNPAGDTNIPIFAIGPNVIATQNLPAIGMQVQSMTLTQPTNLGVRSTPAGGTVNAYSTQFVLVAQKVGAPGQVFQGANAYRKQIQLTVLTDATNNIVDCYGQNSDEAACVDIGGNFEQYDAAKNPRCLLSHLLLSNSFANRDANMAAFRGIGVVRPAALAAGSPHGAAMFSDAGVSGGDPDTVVWMQNINPGQPALPKWGLRASRKGNIGFDVGGVDKFWINSAGRVGIGFAGPAAAVQPPGELEIHSADGSNADLVLQAAGASAAQWDIASLTDGRIAFHNLSPGGFPDSFSLTNDAPNGALRVTGTEIRHAIPFTSTSDIRLKKDLSPISGALEMLMKLKGIYFHWKDSKRSSGKQIGVIAQDVEKVAPELVFTDPDGIKSVNYEGLIPVLLEGVKAQQHRIEELEARLKKLEAQN